MITLTESQQAVIARPLTSRVFLRGPAGTGKTTTGVERLRYLRSRGIAGSSILVLTSHRVLQDPYLDVINPDGGAEGDDLPATMSGLAWRACQLFWPLAARSASFADPDRAPTYLNIESAQYYMAYLVRPLFGQGYFASLAVDRSRIYAQILDDLNRSASVGFPHTEIGARLTAAWVGDPAQQAVYEQAQDCANRFRQFCLDHNLLDYSLLTEVFATHLWPDPQVRSYLVGAYRHLIYDNVEEDVPRSHDVLRDWVPEFESALLIYDDGGGYRRLLGADPLTGATLAEVCEEEVSFTESFVISEPVSRLLDALSRPDAPVEPADVVLPAEVIPARFVPEMVGTVVAQVTALISDQGLRPSEIVILAPRLSDSLRFAVTSRLDSAGIPWRSLRPSRPLHAEPASQVLLTLAALAHPHWNVHPSKFDVAYAFMLCLGMDLVRAQMLAEIVYRPRDLSLSEFSVINEEMRDRLTFAFGDRYSALREWLEEYRRGAPLPLDIVLERLVDQLLVQPGFGFHLNIEAGRVAASLVQSIRTFRQAIDPALVSLDHPDFDFGREYLYMVAEGVLPALYLEAWRTTETDAVLVAPAYSFLVMNKPASVQFWLDAAASTWYEGMVQPLTQPFVLSREWPPGRQWTFEDVEAMDLAMMMQMISGLLHRCRRKIVLAVSNWSETGFEQRGPMLRLFRRVLQQPSQPEHPRDAGQ